MKKIIALLLSVLMLVGMLTVLSGCSQPEAKGKVYYLNPNPEANDTWQALASQYTEETGVEVKVVTAVSENYEDALRDSLTNDHAPTLFQCNTVQDLQTWNEYCLDLTGTTVLKEMTATALNLEDQDGAVKAIAYSFEAFGMIVNKGLLEQAGYDVAEITDFASLKMIAEDIHARSEELGFDAFVAPNLEESSWILPGVLSNTLGYYRLANLPLYYEFRDEGNAEPPAAIQGTYLNAYKNIWDLMIQNATSEQANPAEENIDPDLDNFGSGKAVFLQQGTWVYPSLVSDTYKMKSADLQMIPVYCGVEGEESAGFCCGTQNRWAVNAKASQADIQATLDFLTWVVTSNTSTAALAEQFGAIPFRAAKKPDNIFFADVQQMIADENYIVDWVFEKLPNMEQWSLGVAAALRNYTAGYGSWTAVETAFIDGWGANTEE